RERLDTLQTGDGRLLPDHLKAQVCRELDRLELLLEQIKAVGVSVSESATSFSLTCAGEPASGIAITLPLRTTQASATAAGEQPCAVPICTSVRSVIRGLFSPPSGEYAMIGRSCCVHQVRRGPRSIPRLLRL